MEFARDQYLSRGRQLAEQFPVLCILGPRQCGKTTLAKVGWPDYDYLDLELPSDFSKLSADAELFLTSRRRSLIIDEAQRHPPLFPLLRAIVDRDRKRAGQYLLLGSASFRLVEAINESLSGRVAFLDLTPLLAKECVRSSADIDTHWLKGGFPDAYLAGAPDQLSFEWFEHYSRTLIERDLPALGVEVTPQTFRRLWQMCAHVHGNVLNMNKLAESLGVSPHTVGRYLDILEQSFLIRRLPSFHANTKKRLVKSPKLYLRDSGLTHYFLRILDHEALIVSPDRGKSFEGYVVEQVVGVNQLESRAFEPFFFRTSDQYEVDLVLAAARRRVLIEIKAGTSIDAREISRLQTCKDIIGAKRAFVILYGRGSYPVGPGLDCIGISDWAARGFDPFWAA